MAKLLSWALYVRFAGMFAQLRSLAQWSGGLLNEHTLVCQSAGMPVQQTFYKYSNQSVITEQVNSKQFWDWLNICHMLA